MLAAVSALTASLPSVDPLPPQDDHHLFRNRHHPCSFNATFPFSLLLIWFLLISALYAPFTFLPCLLCAVVTTSFTSIVLSHVSSLLVSLIFCLVTFSAAVLDFIVHLIFRFADILIWLPRFDFESFDYALVFTSATSSTSAPSFAFSLYTLPAAHTPVAAFAHDHFCWLPFAAPYTLHLFTSCTIRTALLYSTLLFTLEIFLHPHPIDSICSLAWFLASASLHGV